MFTGGCSQSGEMRIQRQFTELGTFHLEKGTKEREGAMELTSDI